MKRLLVRGDQSTDFGKHTNTTMNSVLQTDFFESLRNHRSSLIKPLINADCHGTQLTGRLPHRIYIFNFLQCDWVHLKPRINTYSSPIALKSSQSKTLLSKILIWILKLESTVLISRLDMKNFQNMKVFIPE